MKHAICPNCNADVELPAAFAGGDAWCPSCNQGFFVEPDETQEAPRAASRMPQPRRGAPRPPVAPPARSNAPAGNLGPSMRFALIWLASTAGPCFFFLLLWQFTGSEIALLLGMLAGGIFHVACAVLVIAYLRTIALNSEHR